jgi:Uma2 family endonuclease
MIGVSLAAALWVALRNRKCVVAGSDLRVRVSKSGPIVYPDVSVCCGDPELADDYKDILLNPTVVCEVLSPSSEAYDRGRKFASYRQIDSLREYVLVSQSEPGVEIYLRGPEGKWILTEFRGMGAVCRLTSIGCEIALADIYRNVPLADGGE